MALFDVCLRGKEHPRLAEVICKAFRADATFLNRRFLEPRYRDEALVRRTRPAVFARLGQTVRLVICASLRHLRLHHPVALKVVHRAFRGVDRDLVEIGGAQPGFLGVEV